MNSTVRTVMQKAKKQRSGKKDCELGTKCPYQNEYQHTLEFNHEKDVSRVRSEAILSSKNGNKLGGSIISKDDRISKLNSYGNGNKVGNQTSTFDKAKTSVTTSFSSSSNGSSVYNSMAGKENDIFCEKCFEFISCRTFDAHVMTHFTHNSNHSERQMTNSSDTLLRDAQDIEYNQSMLLDMEKSNQQQLLERQKRDEELRNEEERMFEEVLEVSIKEAVKNSKDAAAARLGVDEPVSGVGVVQIRFTFPCGFKISRRFRVAGSIQIPYDFLSTLSECADPSLLTLRYPFGTEVIGRNSDQTLGQLGITTNCNLLVVFVESQPQQQSTLCGTGTDRTGLIIAESTTSVVAATTAMPANILSSSTFSSSSSAVCSPDVSQKKSNIVDLTFSPQLQLPIRKEQTLPPVATATTTELSTTVVGDRLKKKRTVREAEVITLE